MKLFKSTPTTLASQLQRGFTLIEMLVVIAIISLILTAAGPVFETLTATQSPGTVANAISGQLERARSHAMAKNTFVWVRLGAVAEEPKDFFIGVYESLDGSEEPDPKNFKGIWNAPKFDDFKLTKNLPTTFVRPETSEQPEEAVWIRFSPNGQARSIEDTKDTSRVKMQRPEGKIAKLAPLTELGLQPTKGPNGVVPEKLKKDVAAVQIAGLTGQALTFTP